jgi:hypothetical protein
MLAKRKKGSSASSFTIKSYAIFILVILVLVTVVTLFDTKLGSIIININNNISSIGKSYILSSTTTIISNKNISSSCCTFRSWEPWEFCPSSANEVIDLPIYEAAFGPTNLFPGMKSAWYVNHGVLRTRYLRMSHLV